MDEDHFLPNCLHVQGQINLDNSLIGIYARCYIQDFKVPTKGVNYPVKKEQKKL